MALLSRTFSAITHVYLAIGAVFGFIRLMLAFAWSAWHTYAQLPTIGGVEVSPTATFVSAGFGALMLVVFWPLSIYSWLSGTATLGEIFLFPWVNQDYD